MATIRAIASDSSLPGPADFETEFAPTHAFVRRVTGQSLWVLFRVDAEHVIVLALRDSPPVPAGPRAD